MKHEKIADGRYVVRGDDGYRLPGLILGGRRRWLVEVGGQTLPTVYSSCRAAALSLHGRHQSGRREERRK